MGACLTMDFSNLPILFLVGVFLLIGWGAHAVGAYLKIPRVTLLLVVGLLCGPFVFDIFPHKIAQWFPDVAHMALAMVGFLLGSNFVRHEFRTRGRSIIYISLGKTIAAAVFVFVAVLVVSQNLALALLLAGIAPASAPAATIDVIHEARAKGPLTKIVLGVVAIDDVWGVIIFSLLLVSVESLNGNGHLAEAVIKGLWNIGGAIVLGTVIGFPMSWLTGHISKGEPTLVEASGFVFLCGGLALLLDVSYLLACMVLGTIVANFAKHHTRPFRDIENASEPFLIIFFLLAGYKFNMSTFHTFGFLGGVYIVARILGFIGGGYLSAYLAKSPDIVKKHIGWCLFPQAGVALGLALLAAEHFPQLGNTVLSLIVGTTIIFELFGPIVTRWHLHQAGES
jgi:Kef-type K+ transport system membrane component KefB